jgi:hypothetical protein
MWKEGGGWRANFLPCVEYPKRRAFSVREKVHLCFHRVRNSGEARLADIHYLMTYLLNPLYCFGTWYETAFHD